MNLLQKLTRSSDEIVKEIHDSFDNAQEHLLKEAKLIIDKSKSKVSDKAKRLESVGFINSELVIKNRAIQKTLVSSEKDAELVNHYKTFYPFLKFLKEDQLDEICNKYNLIYAPVSRYKKDVPEKNLIEIENVQNLKYEDRKKETHFLKVSKPWTEVPSDLRGILKNGFFVDDYFIPNDDNTLKYAISHGGYKGNYNGYTISTKENAAHVETIQYNKLMIAAPKSHFDLKGLKNKGLGFLNITLTEVKDPIVFRYVRGGIQVITKWGLEADDNLLYNETLN